MMVTMHPGFTDPGRNSQAVFRVVLDAMARPGRIYTVTGPDVPPPPLDCATAGVLLTLVDGETPLWLDEQALASREWAAFHCGASIAPVGEARFAVTFGTASLDSFWAGTDEEPESSATLILQVARLGEGSSFRLAGPGLAVPTALAVSGLSDSFVTEWRSNHRLFPRGVDVILCAGNQLAALPRTVRLEPA